jgi:transcriptional regulator with XRE-family HTH domain
MKLRAKWQAEMTPAQCRAARALLGWTQAKLAKAAGIGIPPESNFEQGRPASADAVQAMQRALESADSGRREGQNGSVISNLINDKE